MTVMEAIKARKSVRRYDAKPIEQEKLDAVLEAGRLAPSASNEQMWHFVVVRDPALRAAMVDACGGQKMVGEAPAVLVLCTDGQKNMLCGQPARTIDCSIALSFMILEAAEQGLGTCWLGHFYADRVKKLLHIPENFDVVAVSPIGYPAEVPSPRPRKAAKEIVSYDGFCK